MYRTLITSGIVLATATAALAQDRTYDHSNFTQIEVSAGVDVDVTVGSDFDVTATALRGDLERLDIIQVGDKLMISRESRGNWGLFSLLRRDDWFQVTVTLPELTFIEATSGSSVDIANTTQALAVAFATSGSSLSIDGDVGDIRVEATSGASLDLSGTCDAMTAEASSGASMDADDLACASVDLHASSGASLDAYAADTAVLEASSGASLALQGGAEITSQSSSSGASISVR